MISEQSVKTLAATSPGRAFRTFRDSSARITQLETQLGLPAEKPIFHISVANARVRELETLLAAKASQPESSNKDEVPAGDPASNVIDFSKWRGMSASNQESFCRDGGKMDRESFLAMPIRAQNFFLAAGGHIANDV